MKNILFQTYLISFDVPQQHSVTSISVCLWPTSYLCLLGLFNFLGLDYSLKSKVKKTKLICDLRTKHVSKSDS
jgi:hypothetical protein